MAIDEINNKTDGIHDRLLPNTQLEILISKCVDNMICISDPVCLLYFILLDFYSAD